MRKAKAHINTRKQPKAKPAAKAAKPRGRPLQNADQSEPLRRLDPHYAFEPPLQSPPAGREYLRALIGRQANPAEDHPRAAAGTKNAGQWADNYFVQLTTFHIRDRGF